MITSNPDTKKLIKKYWAHELPTTRIENSVDGDRKVMDWMYKASIASVKVEVKEKKFLWNPVHSYPNEFKSLFKHRVRRAGEYSWSYQFVLDYNDSLRILCYTEEGMGTSYEYVSGDRAMIIPFLKELGEMITGARKCKNTMGN